MKKKHEFQVRLQRCGLLIWQGAADMNTFSDVRSQNKSHSAIRVDPEFAKGPVVFGFSLP